VDQPDFVTVHVTHQMEGAPHGSWREKRIYREVDDGYPSSFELAAACTIRAETAGMRLKSRAVQRLCDFAQLPLAAASFERAGHQQNRPRH
jgi:hypothetical protein